jgi:predicted transcriptional regulator
MADRLCYAAQTLFRTSLMALSVTTIVELDPDTQARIERLARTRRGSAPLLMREAVEQYVDREEARERLGQDALAAWRAYAATGLHVTEDEADAWLARLEAGEDAPPPECHG